MVLKESDTNRNNKKTLVRLSRNNLHFKKTMNSLTVPDIHFSLQFGLQIKQAIGAVAFKMAAEYKRKSTELRNRLQREGKVGG